MKLATHVAGMLLTFTNLDKGMLVSALAYHDELVDALCNFIGIERNEELEMLTSAIRGAKERHLKPIFALLEVQNVCCRQLTSDRNTSHHSQNLACGPR